MFLYCAFTTIEQLSYLAIFLPFNVTLIYDLPCFGRQLVKSFHYHCHFLFKFYINLLRVSEPICLHNHQLCIRVPNLSFSQLVKTGIADSCQEIENGCRATILA